MPSLSTALLVLFPVIAVVLLIWIVVSVRNDAERRRRREMMRKRRDVQLVCMRLSRMVFVHPQQVEDVCGRCGEAVGIFPSGQAIIRTYRRVTILCEVCGALGEMESRKKE